MWIGTANEEFTLTVPYPLCSTEPFDTNIGPFSSDTNITVTVESQDILSFTESPFFVTETM